MATQASPVRGRGEAAAGSSELDEDARAAETKHHDAVFAELWSECKNNPPGARFSSDLRNKIETMRPVERRALASRTRGGCAPLLLAARRRNAEAVEYLVHVCVADLEQRGVYEAGEAEGGGRHLVTPLWAAAVAGGGAAVRVLLEAGADVDARSDSGSTALRSACFASREAAAALLLAAGADVARANHAGGTCLMNAVRSARLCSALLAAGAAVDARDGRGRTALHHAARDARLDAAQLLLAHGADPTLQTHAGDDALRIAAIVGAPHMVKLLLPRMNCTGPRAADAYELLGATHIDEFNDVAAALHAWRHATMLRYSGGAYAEKRWAAERGGAGGVTCATAARLRLGAARAAGAREWRSARALAALRAGPAAALHAQALLVAARVLGVSHAETACRFMFRGAACAAAFQYERCAELWGWALDARIANDTALCPETCEAACALTRLLVELARRGLPRPPAGAGPGAGAEGEAGAGGAGAVPVRAAEALERLARAAADAAPLLAVRPRSRIQEECNSRTLQCVVHLLHVALQHATAGTPRRRVARAARRALRADVRGCGGETLLHLAVTRLHLPSSEYLPEDVALPSEPVFPSAMVADFLIRCGAVAAAVDRARRTPLHAAALAHSGHDEVIELLLAAGAHLDQADGAGVSAWDALRLSRCGVRPLRHVSLRCLAARALAARPMPAAGEVPRQLRRVLLQHRPAPRLDPPKGDAE